MTVRFTRRELDVMSVLWETGGATVQEVRTRLDDDLAYTSVLSQLQILERKNHVSHEKEGRAYRYLPLTPASAAGETTLERVLDTLYQNSPLRLLAQLVDSTEIPAKELEDMRALLDRELRGEERGEAAAGRGGDSVPEGGAS